MCSQCVVDLRLRDAPVRERLLEAKRPPCAKHRTKKPEKREREIETIGLTGDDDVPAPAVKPSVSKKTLPVSRHGTSPAQPSAPPATQADGSQPDNTIVNLLAQEHITIRGSRD